MELTCLILYDLLKREMDISPPEKKYRDRMIRQILLYTGEKCREDTLYLCTEPVLEEGLFLLVSEKRIKKWHVLCSESQKIASLSRILEIFQTFMRWRERCIILSETEHDLAGLLEHGAAYLSLRISLFDRNYVIQCEYPPGYLTESGEAEELLTEGQGRQPLRMSTTGLQFLYGENPEFDQTFQSRGICHYPYLVAPVSGLRTYYYNIIQRELYLGRFVFIMPEELIGEGIMKLIKYFLIQAENCYQYNCLYQGQQTAPKLFRDMWKLLLQNEPADMAAFDAMLNMCGWKRTDRYQIIRLESHGYFQSDQTLEYYAIHLENLFPLCISVQLDGGLYFLRNLEREKKDDFRRKLADFLRENLFKAGISNVFPDILDTYRYRCQADDALSLGNQAAPNLWRYDFSDYSLAYIKEQCLRQYPAADLCPANLRSLIEYDRTHPGSELVQTLYQYYACQFNGQLAAEKLYIHRTTFFYRMNKIRKIAAFHPENFEETGQIFLAFCLLDNLFPDMDAETH